jgi:hypothetical protein
VLYLLSTSLNLASGNPSGYICNREHSFILQRNLQGDDAGGTDSIHQNCLEGENAAVASTSVPHSTRLDATACQCRRSLLKERRRDEEVEG